ncbi:DBF4-type zinc finger-containing protein 2 isoform X1 [Amia ocellicauda]|uniref:DBF4-type zinc finger-containing protein 2 isoform X1 n=1 Tax=Amia ocellicauda TaxID=2972642 RepID=UPI003464476B
MYDKIMPVEEQSAPSAQEIDRTHTEVLTKADRISGNSVIVEQPVPGPSTQQTRQGFCSCCQVLYNSVEQHILSSRHREFVSSSRNNVACGSLMERFLQDVIQHHPYRYNDTRPTHADLPSLSTPLIPKEELSDLYCVPEDDKETVGTREELPSSDDESCQVIFVEGLASTKKKRIKEGKPSHTHISGKALGTSGGAGFGDKLKRPDRDLLPLDSNSPTQGFLHRTSISSLSGLPNALPGSSQATRPGTAYKKSSAEACCSFKTNIKNDWLKTVNNPALSSKLPDSIAPKPISSDSEEESIFASQGPTGGVVKHYSSQSQGKTSVFHSNLKDVTGAPQTTQTEATMKVLTEDFLDSIAHRERTLLNRDEDAMEETIEEVIEKYCYGVGMGKLDEDEGSFHLSLGSIANPYFSDSGTSMEWDTPITTTLVPCKSEAKDLGCLLDVHINLEDQKYKMQLDSALNPQPESEAKKKKETIKFKEHVKRREWKNNTEDVLPPLPHVPQSFVGKTWSQVMYEDDLKIEALVREFREGCFRCYFDSESLTKFGTRSKIPKNREGVMQETHFHSNLGSAAAKVFPLLNHDDECHSTIFVPMCKTALQKKPGRRHWRLASRCQVVKVSHGTQTSVLNCPVIKDRKMLIKDSELSQAKEVQQELGCEKTPDLKTSFCALKLPEAYSKIMSPLQPKTVVYVLSSPESGQFTLKPVAVRRTGRKRKSTESDSALKYKYKKTPLKYYDPSTNRILKMPPKGVAICKPKKFHHVRQLFRSLSPDINKEKQFVEQKETWSSTKGRTNSISDFCASTSGSCLDSRNEDGLSSNLKGDGTSEQGSSASSRKPVFRSKSRSSMSSNSRFILSPLAPSKSHPESVVIISPLQIKKPERSNALRTRGTRGQAHDKHSESQPKNSREKSLGPTKGPGFHYRTRQVPRRLMERKVQGRSDFTMKTSRCRTARVAEQKNESNKGFLTRGKTRNVLCGSGKASQTKNTKKKPLKGKFSARQTPKVKGVRTQSSGILTRASSKQLEEPLITRTLRSSSKRTLRNRQFGIEWT